MSKLLRRHTLKNTTSCLSEKMYYLQKFFLKRSSERAGKGSYTILSM
jgi:hypothetical protein